MTAEVVERRVVGTVTATVVKCFDGNAWGVALFDTFGVGTSRSTLGPEPPSQERVDEFVAQHVRFSQCHTRRS